MVYRNFALGVNKKKVKTQNSITYVAGRLRGGIAPIAISALPMQYTMDRYRIVLNLPRKLSARMAPIRGKKYAKLVNMWYITVAVSSS